MTENNNPIMKKLHSSTGHYQVLCGQEELIHSEMCP